MLVASLKCHRYYRSAMSSPYTVRVVTINKSELVSNVAASAGISKTQAAKLVDAFIDTASTPLSNGETLTLVGFGTFETRQHEARTGRNPQTGKEIQISAATLPAFRPGRALKDAVN